MRRNIVNNDGITKEEEIIVDLDIIISVVFDEERIVSLAVDADKIVIVFKIYLIAWEAFVEISVVGNKERIFSIVFDKDRLSDWKSYLKVDSYWIISFIIFLIYFHLFKIFLPEINFNLLIFLYKENFIMSAIM